MTVTEPPPARRSYLLTLWQERGHDAGMPGTWRFSLEDVHTGRRRAFPNLEALVAALEEEMAGEGMEEHKPWASR